MNAVAQIAVAFGTGIALVLACGFYAAERWGRAAGCAALMTIGVFALGHYA